MLDKPSPLLRSLGLSLSSLVCSTLSLMVAPTSVQAAERLFFVYNPLKLSLRVDSLELFAKENKVNRDLGFYFDLAGVTAETQATLRQILTKRAELDDPLYVPRFFNSSTGEALLEQIGKLIGIPWNINGKRALRGALIQAALDPNNGLTLINVLKKYPTDIHVDVEKILKAAELINLLGEETNDLVAEMKLLNTQQAAKHPEINYAALPDIRQPGSIAVAPEQVWNLTDSKRDRSFRVLVYQPQQWQPGKTPVVVISHGLASRPEDFAERAKQLASYGFFVVLPQHPGSDNQKLKDLLAGDTKELFDLDEFINRPLDVSFVLDELERRNPTQFGDRLDLNNVGFFGHSFGGYTGMALAGAEIDFGNLAQDCNQPELLPDVSLLLECRALELPHKVYSLRDERVQAVFLANPVTGSIFGAKGLAKVKIPVLMVGGSSDPATPVAVEQLRAFVWLGSKDKRLALVKGQAHVNFTQLDASTKAILDSIKNLQLPNQKLIDQYINAYIVVFAKYYLAQDANYRPYLDPGYAIYVSKEPNTLSVVDASAAKTLADFYNQRKPSDRPAIIPTE